MGCTLSQLSMAVAWPVFAGSVDALQSSDTSFGTLSAGGVRSTTTMVCVPDAALPLQTIYVRKLRNSGQATASTMRLQRSIHVEL
jgi:hypothetical protein